MGILLALAGRGLAAFAGNMLAASTSEKVIKKIMIILIDKLIKGTKTDTDDKIWAEIKSKLDS